MPHVKADPAKVKTFENAIAFYKKKIAAFVDMLKRGETIHPQGKRSSTGRPR